MMSSQLNMKLDRRVLVDSGVMGWLIESLEFFKSGGNSSSVIFMRILMVHAAHSRSSQIVFGTKILDMKIKLLNKNIVVRKMLYRNMKFLRSLIVILKTVQGS
jgi:hypothetical protein